MPRIGQTIYTATVHKKTRGHFGTVSRQVRFLAFASSMRCARFALTHTGNDTDPLTYEKRSRRLANDLRLGRSATINGTTDVSITVMHQNLY